MKPSGGRGKSKEFGFCPQCKRDFTEAELAERKLKKIQNAHASRAKAIANGTAFGRKWALPPDDRQRVREDRAAGASLRALAGKYGVSTTAIQRAIQEKNGTS